MADHSKGSGAQRETSKAEPHWGDPNRSQVRKDVTRGEVVVAIVWLSVAALASLVIEIVYLGARIQVGDLSVPVPWVLVLAYVMNLILTNTALLWTSHRGIAAVPLVVWIIGLGLVLLWPAIPGGGDTAMGPWIRTSLLITAGAVGGFLPLLRPR